MHNLRLTPISEEYSKEHNYHISNINTTKSYAVKHSHLSNGKLADLIVDDDATQKDVEPIILATDDTGTEPELIAFWANKVWKVMDTNMSSFLDMLKGIGTNDLRQCTEEIFKESE